MRKIVILVVVLMLLLSGFLVSASSINIKKTSYNQSYKRTEDTNLLTMRFKEYSTSKNIEINQNKDNNRYFVSFAKISTSDNFLAKAFVQRSFVNLELAVQLQIYEVISGSLYLEKINGEIIEVGEGSSVYPIGFSGYFKGYKTNDMPPLIWNITKIGPSSFGFLIFIYSPVEIQGFPNPDIVVFQKKS